MKDNYVIITGANGGIGQALCKIFSENEYQVIALDRHATPKEKLLCKEYIQIDLCQFVKDEVYARKIIVLIQDIINAHSLKAVINNAAVQILGGVDILTRDNWHETLNVNLLAPFFLVQSLRNELESSKGSVVNISSIHAKLTKKDFVAYATSKAALSGMTRAMAVDLGSRIRVNAIEPAAIETDMLKAGFLDDTSKYELLKKCHPIGRIGRSDEVAQLVAFLVNNQAGFIHGSCIGVDGGIVQRLYDPI